MLPSALLSFILTTAFATTALSLAIHDDHEHDIPRRFVSGAWHHPRDHPIGALFKRGGDGASYPAVGSSEWTSKYPVSDGTTPKNIPQEWKDALSAAVAAGKIPDIPVSTLGSAGVPVYPNNLDPSSPDICSSNVECKSDDDIYDGPDGTFSVNFDDGPLPPTDTLVDFLDKNNLPATHFMIGANILTHPSQFSKVYARGDDLAVHTWSHPYMTTLTNEEILSELGWTMQIIHDSSEGRVPKLWRPPTGDSDKRVRAIAKYVFGMDTVIWNQDTDDWQLTTGKQNAAAISSAYDGWVSGPKSPGLIILEHELSDQSVQAFMDNFPKVPAHGWKPDSLARLVESGPYQNVQGNNVAAAGIIASGQIQGNSSSSVPTSNTATSASGTSTSVSGTSAGTKSTTSAAGAKTSGASSSNSNTNSNSASLSRQFAGLSTMLIVALSALVFLS